MKYFYVLIIVSVGIMVWLLSPSQSPAQKTCDPAYPDPDLCIPSPPPDLDCKDIDYRNFRVLPPDPHRFDGDKDGIGCEQSQTTPSQ